MKNSNGEGVKRFLRFKILLGLLCWSFIFASTQPLHINKIKSSLVLPFRLIGNNLNSLIFWGVVSCVGVYATKTLLRYLNEGERVYEVDEMTKVAISAWPVDFPQEYKAIIKNRMTNESYGYLIYQLQEPGLIFIRKLEIERGYRKKGYGSKLLKTVLKVLPSLHGCKKVTLFASPIALNSGETKQEFLSKLIAFYQNQGAEVKELKYDGAWMEFNLIK